MKYIVSLHLIVLVQISVLGQQFNVGLNFNVGAMSELTSTGNRSLQFNSFAQVFSRPFEFTHDIDIVGVTRSEWIGTRFYPGLYAEYQLRNFFSVRYEASFFIYRLTYDVNDNLSNLFIPQTESIFLVNKIQLQYYFLNHRKLVNPYLIFGFSNATLNFFDDAVIGGVDLAEWRSELPVRNEIVFQAMNTIPSNVVRGMVGIGFQVYNFWINGTYNKNLNGMDIRDPAFYDSWSEVILSAGVHLVTFVKKDR